MKFLDKIVEQIPEIKEHFLSMEMTEQDPLWHGEGNVMVHTEMVLTEVENLITRENLNDETAEILRYAAIFHDIGKPKTTVMEDGRLRTHGHSRLGYHLTLELLENTDLELHKIRAIANLVLRHGEPNWVFEKKDPEREVIRLSMECNLEHLYWLCTCDNKGRIADDVEELIIKLEYFKEVSEKLDCFTKPFIFSNEITRFNYLVRKTHHFTDSCFDTTKSKVIMMAGLPGSGKDTYIHKNLQFPVISLDEIRKELKIKPTDEQGLVFQTAKARAKEFLRKGKNFVWNATNVTKQIRSGIIDLFDTYDAHITVIFIHKPLSVIKEQNSQRDAAVPIEVIEKLHRKMEIPSLNEAHQIIII